MYHYVSSVVKSWYIKTIDPYKQEQNVFLRENFLFLPRKITSLLAMISKNSYLVATLEKSSCKKTIVVIRFLNLKYLSFENATTACYGH